MAVLAVHPVRVAATRLRAEQHRPAIEAAGGSMRLWSFLADRDLDGWFGRSQVRRALAVLRSLPRLLLLPRLLRGADIVIVQREALPFGPPVIELLAARRRPMVWDVDDAIWESYVSPTAGRVPRWIRATADKHRRICAAATEVWPGSEVLADWCRRWNDHVTVVPTVVDVPAERPAPSTARVVGWIGSHSTAEFVEAVLPAVARVNPPASAVIVGAKPAIPAGFSARTVPWSPSAERDALAATRVGLYPIDRHHPLADGKCGLKAILFMAAGIPTVVTPTTTNAAVVRDGVEGLHADTEEEWTDAVARLLDDDELWTRCSAASHERAAALYSVQVWSPWIADRLRALARSGGR